MEVDIVIDPELRALITPLSEEEREGLERDLLRDGCRDPLVVWRQDNGDLLLLDGHNRHEICQRHGLSYETTVLELPSREAALIWICENQLHRRNLNETQRAMLGDKIATMRQGTRTDLSPIGGMSQAQAAQVMKVSARSIQRAGLVRQHGSPQLIEATRRGTIPVSVAEALTRLAPEEQERIAQECLERGDARPARDAAATVRTRKRKARAVQNHPHGAARRAQADDRGQVLTGDFEDAVTGADKLSSSLFSLMEDALEAGALTPERKQELTLLCQDVAKRFGDVADALFCARDRRPAPGCEVNLD